MDSIWLNSLDSIWLNSESAVVRIGEIMIAIGIILLIIGFLTKIAIVWTKRTGLVFLAYDRLSRAVSPR